MATSPSPETAAPADGNQRRTRLLLGITGAFVILGLAWLAWHLLVGRWYESTNDAYVVGNAVQVTPQIAGTVVAIEADDTQFVKAGQPLVRLDGSDAKVALDLAEATLAKTVRQVRNLYSTSAQFGASVTQRESDLAKARADLARREQLAAIGGVSEEEIQHARDAVAAATAALAAASEQLGASRALVDHTTLEDHPDVKAAAANFHEAWLGAARTSLLAPVSGVVARRSVQVGQRVSPGTPLMSVVALDDVWVDANFKEDQLAGVHLGQPVKLQSDLYGGDVVFHGKVSGFGAGTGSAFALLPPQNATGNWIKVVQRVPVRIALDAEEVRRHPLQVGLSMTAEVDTHERQREALPKSAAGSAVYSTDVFDTLNRLADQRVAEIIAANGGHPAAVPGHAGKPAKSGGAAAQPNPIRVTPDSH